MKRAFRVDAIAIAALALSACSRSPTDDGYVSPPADPTAKALAAKNATQDLATTTYESVGKPFGCDTDCKDEEIGFSEARRDNVTKSEDCTAQFSDKSLMSNATQDGCHAYVRARNSLTDSNASH
jgi:hypothetical protein